MAFERHTIIQITNFLDHLKLKEKIREEFFDDDVSGSEVSETTATTSKVIY